MHKAVFMDRDGTITEEVGYINHPSRLKLFDWTVEAIRQLNRAGLKAVVITNQAGVARGYFTEDLVKEVHLLLTEQVSRAGARLDGIYYCAHHPSVGEPPYRQDCDCRKPRPGLLHRAASELGIDLANSYMVGDRYGDVELARSVGARAILVKTGYGLGEYTYQRPSWPEPPDYIAEDLLDAVCWIIKCEGGMNPSEETIS